VQNRHLELMQLRALQHMQVPFDVAAFAALRLRELKQEERAVQAEGGERSGDCLRAKPRVAEVLFR
jgi:hypothetical protein